MHKCCLGGLEGTRTCLQPPTGSVGDSGDLQDRVFCCFQAPDFMTGLALSSGPAAVGRHSAWLAVLWSVDCAAGSGQDLLIPEDGSQKLPLFGQLCPTAGPLPLLGSEGNAAAGEASGGLEWPRPSFSSLFCSVPFESRKGGGEEWVRVGSQGYQAVSRNGFFPPSMK